MFVAQQAGVGGGVFVNSASFLCAFRGLHGGSPTRHVIPHHELLQATSSRDSSLPAGRHHQAFFLGGLWRKCEACGCFGECKRGFVEQNLTRWEVPGSCKDLEHP